MFDDSIGRSGDATTPRPSDWTRRLGVWLAEAWRALFAGRGQAVAAAASGGGREAGGVRLAGAGHAAAVEVAAAEADARRAARAEAEARYTFKIPARRVGCLLVHGLTSTPQSLRDLGTYMAEHGIEVEALLLPGHGTTPEDLETTTWMDWYGAVSAALRRMRPQYDRLFVCGQSMGGALALRAAAHESVDGVLGLAAFIYLRDWRLRFLPVIKHIRRWRHSIGNDIADPETRDEVCYDRLSFRTIEQLVLLGRTVKEDLPLVRVPAFVVQSRVDHVVPPDTADYIYDHIASQDRELLRLEHSYHVISMDYERDLVAERCVRFLRRVGYAEARRGR